MFWPKPLIIVDVETNSIDSHLPFESGQCEIHELGAIFIDNNTLETISTFESECKIYHPEFSTKGAFRLSDISLEEVMKRDKTPEETITDFHNWIVENKPPATDRLDYFNFGSWNTVFDISLLKSHYYRAGLYDKFQKFDHHHLDLWTFFAIFRKLLGKNDNLTGSKQALRELGLYEKALNFQHRGLADCEEEGLVVTSVLQSLESISV